VRASVKFLSKKFRAASLKNKIFFSSLAVLFLLSFIIALFTRWILFTSLTSELKLRGKGIAGSVAKSCRGYVLTENIPELTSLIFNERLGERKYLIAYIFVLGKKNNVLAHTFIDSFPEDIIKANCFEENGMHTSMLINIGGEEVFDITAPVEEGIYQIGSVHIGLKREHIDNLMTKLRTTFLGFLSSITILFFWISNLLSKYISRPITELTRISDEISRGNLDISQRSIYEINEQPGESDPGDEVMQLSHSFYNMTSRLRLSQKDLRESEDKYRSLFISGPSPIFVLDRATLEILDINPSAEETFGYKKEETITKFFTDFGRFEYEDKDPLEIIKKGWPEDYILNMNVRYYAHGSSQPLSIRVKACPAQYSNRDALILSAIDITEMVEQEEKLIQTSKMATLGLMAAGIAHELNQPLNAIRLGNEYLSMMVEKGKKIPDENLTQVASEVSGQVGRASEIINRLREFGRKTDFAKENVSLNDNIQNVLRMIGKQLSIDNITVTLELDKNLPLILANNNRMDQVIFNLVANARDAIYLKNETDKSIAIRTFQESGSVLLEVSDTGAGIPDDVKEKVFDPFFTTKEVGKGMGLGLSIIYGIVKDYGGDITVESEKGKGTTFRQRFPAVSS
jgi:PAS domain S-box-containing protein